MSSKPVKPEPNVILAVPDERVRPLAPVFLNVPAPLTVVVPV